MKRQTIPTVTTIVLTWNSADFIEECLKSLLKSEFRTEILVVDNDSTDATRELVAKKFPNINLVNSHANLGYAGGNNFGLRQLEDLQSEYLFILNPDAGVEPDCITKLVHRMETQKQLAGISPVIYHHGGKKIWYAGSNINWKSGDTPHVGWGEEDEGQYDNKKDTERLNGCAMLLRRDIIERSGLFDENYFLYYEESDLSVRLARKGYKLGLEAQAHVWHRVSSSTGGYDSKTYQYYMTRNKLYFIHKFRPHKFSFFFARSVAQSTFELAIILKKRGPRLFAHVAYSRLLGYKDYIFSKFGKQITR